jgi:hypothetical protein
VRCSTNDVSSPAGTAVASLITISPAFAIDARRGGVDRVADRREVDRVALGDVADVGEPGVDADADRNPGVSVAVARLEEIPRGRDGAGRVILAGKSRG